MKTAATELARVVVVALMMTPDGRYLMQLRDDTPSIWLPNHWGLFGGSIEPEEDEEEALARELFEELEFRPRRAARFTAMDLTLPTAPPRTDRMVFFEVPVTEQEIAAMVQHEGGGKRLFQPEALAVEPNVAPWDLAAVLMHVRRARLFVGR